MKNIAIFASGSGTNAENLIHFFRTDPSGEVKLVLSNKPDAMVLNRAENLGIESFAFSKSQFYESDDVIEFLHQRGIDFIVLAGFLWLVPDSLLKAYDNKIVNIHPALLPAYGGKGMFGEQVHKSVIENREKQSGITIHQVNQNYDEGRIVFQATCTVDPGETPETLAQKIHRLEYEHYPRVVAGLLNEL